MFLLVFVLGVIAVQGALLPTIPFTGSSINGTIVGCARLVYLRNIPTSQAQPFSFAVTATAITTASGSDLTIHITRQQPDDIHFQGTCDLGVPCSTDVNDGIDSCTANQDCADTGNWYIIVQTSSSGEEEFTLEYSDSSISTITLPLSDEDEDIYPSEGVVTADDTDGTDFFRFSVPTSITPTTQLKVRFKAITGATVSVAVNPTRLSGASCSAFLTATDSEGEFRVDPCDVVTGDWFIAVQRLADQRYQVKAWLEDIGKTLTLNGESHHIVFSSEEELLFTIDGLDQLTDDDDLVVSVENVLSLQSYSLYLTSGDVVPPPVCGTPRARCENTQGLCMLSVSPCDRQGTSNWYAFFQSTSTSSNDPGEWSVKAFSRKIQEESRDNLNTIFGELPQSGRAVYSVPKPTRMNDWLELDIYMTDFSLASQAYYSLYVFKDDTICRDNVFKACTFRQLISEVISCTIQLDPCELELLGDRIHFVVENDMFGAAANTVHTTQYTIDLKVRNPYVEPDRIQRGEIVVDGLPERQFTKWPQTERSSLTRLYFVDPIPFGNFTFTFTPTSGDFLIQMFNVLDGKERKIGPSCDCWGANTVVSQSGTTTRIYSVDNYAFDAAEEYETTFPHGLFIAVQPNSDAYADYEYNLRYTVRGSNPTFAGSFSEGRDYKIEGMVTDEYRYYELHFDRSDLYFKYMLLDFKAVPDAVGVSLFSLSTSLLEALKTGTIKADEFKYGVPYFSYNSVGADINGEVVYVSDCLWRAEGDDSHWVLFVISHEDDGQFNLRFDVPRARPRTLEAGKALEGELNGYEYHYFELDVPESSITENHQLIVEVYGDQRHEDGTGVLQSFTLFHRNPAEFPVLTGTGECRCSDNSESGSHRLNWIGSVCNLEPGLHTFSVTNAQQNPLPAYKVKYTIRAFYVDLYRGDLQENIPVSGEVFWDQTVHYSFSPPNYQTAYRFQVEVFSPYIETLGVRVVEQNNTCSCPGTIYRSCSNNVCLFEWAYCQATESRYYLTITGQAPATQGFPIHYTVVMRNNVRHPTVTTLTLGSCSDPLPAETFVYTGQYKHYRIDLAAQASMTLEITGVIDGNLVLYQKTGNLSVAECTPDTTSNIAEGSDYTLSICTPTAASYYFGIFGESNHRHDAVRYTIRACTNPARNYQTLGTTATGTVAAGGSTTIYYDLSGALGSGTNKNFGLLVVNSTLDPAANIQVTVARTPSGCSNCLSQVIAGPSGSTTFIDMYHACNTAVFPDNYDNFDYYMTIVNLDINDAVPYEVRWTFTTAPPFQTLVNNVTVNEDIAPLSWAHERYIPATYNADTALRRVLVQLAIGSGLDVYFSTAQNTCGSLYDHTANPQFFCCEEEIHIYMFNPTVAAIQIDVTIIDHQTHRYSSVALTNGAGSVTVPAVTFDGQPEFSVFSLNLNMEYVPHSLLFWNFSTPLLMKFGGPYYPSSQVCLTNPGTTFSSSALSYTAAHSGVVDDQLYLNVEATGASQTVDIRIVQINPIEISIGGNTTYILTELYTPFVIKGDYSPSDTRFWLAELTSDDPFSVFTFSGAALPSTLTFSPLCDQEDVTFLVSVDQNDLPITLRVAASIELSSDPFNIYIPVNETRSFPGDEVTSNDWFFETTIPDNFGHYDVLIFTFLTNFDISGSVSHSFGCGAFQDLHAEATVCIQTKDALYQCTISFTRSELLPSSFLRIAVYGVTHDFDVSYSMLRNRLVTVGSDTAGYSLVQGEVYFFKWTSPNSHVSAGVVFETSDPCGDFRFYVIDNGGIDLGSVPRIGTSLPGNPYPFSTDSQQFSGSCDVHRVVIVAVLLNSAQNAETSVGFSVTPSVEDPDHEEVVNIYPNEEHVLLGRRAPNPTPTTDNCPQPYASTGYVSECTCPVVTNTYTEDSVLYHLTFDGYYLWDNFEVTIQPSEYVTSMDTITTADRCASNVWTTDSSYTVTDNRHLYLRIRVTAFTSIPEDLEEFPVATIHVRAYRVGRIPIHYSDEPQYVLFTLALLESQHFEIIHDDHDKVNYRPSFRIVAATGGLVGFTSGNGGLTQTTAGAKCLDRIASPDCPGSFPACSVGSQWFGNSYPNNIFNRTYVRIQASTVAGDSEDQVVRGIAEFRFVRPYTLQTFAVDVCYEIETGDNHVLFFNTSVARILSVNNFDGLQIMVSFGNSDNDFYLLSGTSLTTSMTVQGQYIITVYNDDLQQEPGSSFYSFTLEDIPSDPARIDLVQGHNSIVGTDANCDTTGRTRWKYDIPSSAAMTLIHWNPIDPSNGAVTINGLGQSVSGRNYRVLCYNSFTETFDTSNNQRRADLVIKTLTAPTPTVVNIDDGPHRVALPAPGQLIAIELGGVSATDFDGAFRKAILVTFHLERTSGNYDFAPAIFWTQQNCFNIDYLDASNGYEIEYEIDKCSWTSSLVHYFYVPDNETCSGVVLEIEFAWIEEEPAFPTGKDVTFNPTSGSLIPYRFTTTLFQEYVYYRMTNIRGTLSYPSIDLHFGCCNSRQLSFNELFCVSCSGQLTVSATLASTVTLLPGYSQVTADIEVLPVPRQILPDDESVLESSITDPVLGHVIIEASLSPYRGHSYIFEIADGGYALNIQFQIRSGCTVLTTTPTSSQFNCLPGSACHYSVPFPYHLRTNTPVDYVYIHVEGRSTDFTVRRVSTEEETCAVVSSATAPFCHDVLSGDQWSVTNNHTHQDIFAESFYEQLVEDFSCESFTGSVCDCPGELSSNCEAALKAFACLQTFLECSGSGFGHSAAAPICNDVERFCGKTFFEAAPNNKYTIYDCRHNNYEGGVLFVDSAVPEYEDQPLKFSSASSIFTIFTFAIILALLLI